VVRGRLATLVASTIGRTAQSILTFTVVGVLGQDDLDTFNALVAQIEDELDLDAEVALHVGSFSVRFSPRAPSN
jgi:hypothetical protein